MYELVMVAVEEPRDRFGQLVEMHAHVLASVKLMIAAARVRASTFTSSQRRTDEEMTASGLP
jgi:hypothetical protein